MAKPGPQHETVGFTKHLYGAVVPVDTTSVLQQKALHGTAYATAAVNGYDRLAGPPKFPKAVEPPEATKIVPYTYPFTYGLQYQYPKVQHPQKGDIQLLLQV